MASYKKAGNCNIVRKGQIWKSRQNGKFGVIKKRSRRDKEWIIAMATSQHHINEGTLLKYFDMVT